MEDYENEAAEAARAQAEARRKRILEKAEKRMGVVNGEPVQDQEEKVQSATTAARIRAARQRRYGKKSATTTTTTTTMATSPTPETDTPVAAPTPSDKDNAVEKSNHNDGDEEEEPFDIPKTKETPKEPAEPETTTAEPATMTEAKEESTVPAEEPVVDDSAPSEVAPAGGDEEGDEPKKKYVGVARMRRRILQKKKLEEAAAAASAEAPQEETVTPVATTIVPPRVLALPIYMHIFTVLLLFLAGVDVGVQQFHHQVQVDSQLAILQHGLPLIHRSFQVKPSPTKGGIDSLLHDVNAPPAVDGTPYDEFQDDDEGVDGTTPNIDPLFRVDLDQLTRGPGVLKQLARFAVGIHRSLLGLFFYWPLGILQAILGIPQALMRFPPALCILALVLRQVVGKTLLGANIPEVTTQSEGDPKATMDIMAMVKNFFNTFLKANFPTIVGLYDAFNHLRSDMYVILCGVFCGLIWVHWSDGTPATLETTGMDEL